MTTHFLAVPGGRTAEKDTGPRTARARGAGPTPRPVLPHPAHPAHDAHDMQDVQGAAVGGGAR
ncbi:hypothetical protein AB5J56_01185 [Streptomyces sp. R21]|uniref:Uncharacterized protein n=1 Tax=Streptomyces sp. R21 TaxID=3238627 RepID=A0AB39NYE5_9ACTN